MRFWAICANRGRMPDGHEMALHADSCQSRERRTRPDGFSFEAANVDEALAYVIDDEMEEMGYEQADVYVFPCTKGGKD